MGPALFLSASDYINERLSQTLCSVCSLTERSYLYSNNVLSLWAFLALSYGELNLLTFGQGFKA